jgi:hypothetical protein
LTIEEDRTVFQFVSEQAIMWNSAASLWVSVKIGVRQGGVLSPSLFQLYLNDLIDLGLCYFVGQVHFGIVAYANDIWISENFMNHQIRSTRRPRRGQREHQETS